MDSTRVSRIFKPGDPRAGAPARERVARLLERGLKAAEISEILGINRSRVYRLIAQIRQAEADREEAS